MLIIVPKPGRDYESAIYAEADFREGRDFYVSQPGHIWHGLPVWRDDFVRHGINSVRLIFGRGSQCHEFAVAAIPPVPFDRRRS